MTYSEKIELAKNLRANRLQNSLVPEKYKVYMEGTKVEKIIVETSEGPCTVYRVEKPGRTKESAAFISIHGGGFVQTYDPRDLAFAQRIAFEVGIVVFDVDYNLSPEYAFPSAINQVYEMTAWIFQNAGRFNILADRIMMGGHSAGGSLTAAVALKANTTKAFKLALQILDYPALDQVVEPEDRPPVPGNIIPNERMRAFRDLYINRNEDRKDPLASPVLAPPEMLRGLPRAVVNTAETDILCSEGERYALMLAQSGVEVTLKRWPGSGHGFITYFNGQYDEAISSMEKAMREIMTL